MTEASSQSNDARRRRQAGVLLVLLLATVAVASAWARKPAPLPPVPPTSHIAPSVPIPEGKARVDVAFVLDTTGSMSGLIEGAKQKIWSIANQLASAEQQTDVRIALIGYRDRGDAYVTRRFDLTDDIDSIYRELRAFGADGGGDTPESVNQALNEAVTRLSWTPGDDVYRVIFLVGDAPPHMDYQDDVPFAQSVRLARQLDIAVNTVQCGSISGTAQIWQQIASLGHGQYATIAQDGGMVARTTPLDDRLGHLNRELATTAVPYGAAWERADVRRKVDAAVAAPPEVVADRLAYLSKSGAGVVSGAKDLLDALAGGLDVGSVEEDSLPEPLQEMEPTERKEWLAVQQEKRARLKAEIAAASSERDGWLAADDERRRAEGEADGFDGRVFDTIREQAAKKGIAY
jgi:Mg-chelatase subunit ChlD